jgi:hypothetical protein
VEHPNIVDPHQHLVHAEVEPVQHVEAVTHNTVTQCVRTVPLIVKVALIKIQLRKMENRVVSSQTSHWDIQILI